MSLYVKRSDLDASASSERSHPTRVWDRALPEYGLSPVGTCIVHLGVATYEGDTYDLWEIPRAYLGAPRYYEMRRR